MAEAVKIKHIEVIPIVVPLAETFRGSKYSMSERATLITRVFTDDGVVGEAYNGDEPDTQHEIARIILDELQPLVMGRDPLMVEQCWEAMLPPTYDILRNRKLVVMAIAAVDSALWDLVGKVAGLSVSELWGGYRRELPIMAIGGYYGKTDAQLAAEMQDYRDMDLCGCKLKIGGLSPAEDAHRFKVAQAAAGDDFVFTVDANQGYSVTEAVEFVRLVGVEHIRWFEEPVRWYNDVRGMRDVRFMAGVQVAAGQSEFNRQGVGGLISSGAIDVCNYDASWGGGPTEWRRIAGMAQVYGVEMGHHEEAQIAAHMLASVPHGTYVEVFHPTRDPLFWELIANRPPIANGRYTVPSGPGWGLELDWDYVEHHRDDK
ncbi:MAG: mandelate racemase/muconate lactonizing enzyme family protein [bacterium]|nr:mandelate racemase/muconate lactonizing enzyme family protein [bacterium]MDE0217178.1 mandelate racemase/muconate lactonizing enzyme family protein [bacterium]